MAAALTAVKKYFLSSFSKPQARLPNRAPESIDLFELMDPAILYAGYQEIVSRNIMAKVLNSVYQPDFKFYE